MRMRMRVRDESVRLKTKDEEEEAQNVICLDKQNVSHTYTGQTKYHQTQIDYTFTREQNRNSAPNHKFVCTKGVPFVIKLKDITDLLSTKICG
jgi:hypothetical protein